MDFNTFYEEINHGNARPDIHMVHKLYNAQTQHLFQGMLPQMLYVNRDVAFSVSVWSINAL